MALQRQSHTGPRFSKQSRRRPTLACRPPKLLDCRLCDISLPRVQMQITDGQRPWKEQSLLSFSGPKLHQHTSV
jgi:hypothetical protein